MAPLQKRAWLALAVALAFGAAIVAVLVIQGVNAFHEDTLTRVIVSVLFVGGLALYAVSLAFPPLRRGPVLRDERDEEVARRAPLVQLWAVVFSLVAWMIDLTEVYWDQGSIPIVFPYLIFISIMIVSVLAQAAGILIGYWRMS